MYSGFSYRTFIFLSITYRTSVLSSLTHPFIHPSIHPFIHLFILHAPLHYTSGHHPRMYFHPR